MTRLTMIAATVAATAMLAGCGGGGGSTGQTGQQPGDGGAQTGGGTPDTGVGTGTTPPDTGQPGSNDTPPDTPPGPEQDGATINYDAALVAAGYTWTARLGQSPSRLSIYDNETDDGTAALTKEIPLDDSTRVAEGRYRVFLTDGATSGPAREVVIFDDGLSHVKWGYWTAGTVSNSVFTELVPSDYDDPRISQFYDDGGGVGGAFAAGTGPATAPTGTARWHGSHVGFAWTDYDEFGSYQRVLTGADMIYEADNSTLRLFLGPTSIYPRGVAITVPFSGASFAYDGSNYGSDSDSRSIFHDPNLSQRIDVPNHSFEDSSLHVAGGFHGEGAQQIVGMYHFDNFSTIGGFGSFGGSTSVGNVTYDCAGPCAGGF